MGAEDHRRPLARPAGDGGAHPPHPGGIESGERLVEDEHRAIVQQPADGAMIPARHRSVVVLPAPFGPTRPSTSPGPTVKEMRSTAVNAPYCLASRSTEIIGSRRAARS
jgi:hypothetical protein